MNDWPRPCATQERSFLWHSRPRSERCALIGVSAAASRLLYAPWGIWGDEMSNLRRRLFQSFVDTGGDLVEDDAVEFFVRFVEARFVLLPTRVRSAIEVAWRDGPNPPRIAARLSEMEGRPVSETAVRQRMSRGARLLVEAIRSRPFGRARRTR